MSRKNKIARKKYWSSIPSEIKTERMREIAKKRWDNASSEERKKQGEMLAISRKKVKNA